MRIIAGKWKGKTIGRGKVGENTRPTADRVRETVFNILENYEAVNSAVVLDLCAGTGSLGFEALSRGAGRCVFVEHDRKTALELKYTAKQLMEDTASVNIVSVDCVRFLKQTSVTDNANPTPPLQTYPAPFTLVFCDPPYSALLLNTVTKLLACSSAIASQALFILEHDKREYILLPEGVHHIDKRIFGDTVVDILQKV